MSDVQTNLISTAPPESRKFSTLLRGAILGVFRRRTLDTRSLPDSLRRDIGLPPAELSIDREISMANVNLRAGIIFPRPC